jgi:hypothetical protein
VRAGRLDDLGELWGDQVRRLHRSDYTQNEIVKALRAYGAIVYHIGRPCDLLVRDGIRYLLLDCDGVTRNRKRDPKQLEGFAQWGVIIVKTPADALNALARGEKLA